MHFKSLLNYGNLVHTNPQLLALEGKWLAANILQQFFLYAPPPHVKVKLYPC
jgi:hypothetical protein